MDIYKIFINNEIDYLIQDELIDGIKKEELTEAEREEIQDNFMANDDIWEEINTFLIDEIKRIIKRNKKK